MSKIPIRILKIYDESLYRTADFKFQINISDGKSKWDSCYECGTDELIKFYEELTKIVDSIKWFERLGINPLLGSQIERANASDAICAGCSHKLSKNCVKCLTDLQSPLERKMYARLLDSKIYFEIQYPIDLYGKKASIQEVEATDLREKYRNFLTQPDFFIPNGRNPICIYADGHTYHERTEEQAKRDRAIDRKLQELQFTVMRFTGKEINDTLDFVIAQIEKMVQLKQ